VVSEEGERTAETSGSEAFIIHSEIFKNTYIVYTFHPPWWGLINRGKISEKRARFNYFASLSSRFIFSPIYQKVNHSF